MHTFCAHYYHIHRYTEKKFVPIEEVADSDADFFDKEEEGAGDDEANEEEAEHEEADDESQIEEVRKSIGDYTFKQRGSKFSNLESFHVDHDNEEVLAVGANAELTAEDVEEKEDDFELAGVDNSEAKIGKMPGHLSMDPKRTRTPRRIDNLKTWNDNKRQRAERGAIREFIDQPLESSEDIKREEELEKINQDNKSLFRRFLDRLN